MRKYINAAISNKSVIFLTILFLVGILTIMPYGSYLDQEEQQRIMYANVKEYLIQFGMEDIQLVRDMTDYGVIEISIDEDRDHGMAAYYPMFGIWYINQHSRYLGNIIWHVYTFILYFWGVCSLFFLCKALFNNGKVAGFTTLLFYLTPRMFAESHYNNKDTILLSLLFCMLHYGYLLLKDTSVKNICMLAFTGALATNFKIVGAWFFGVIGLYCLAYLVKKKRFDKRTLIKCFFCIGLWIGLYILLSPAAWNDIRGYFEYLISGAVDYALWNDYVLFGGQMIHKDYTGMPQKYLLVMIGLTVPVVILLLSVVGTVWVAVTLIKRKRLWDTEGYICVAFATGAVPLAFAVLWATPLYNGWRHFYFVYAAIILAVGYVCHRIKQMVAGTRKETIAVAGGVFYLGVLVLGIAMNYPHEHSYYNVLAGRNVVHNYELDYWDMSIKQALEDISDDVEEGKSITVGTMNLPTMWGINEHHKILRENIKQKVVVIEDEKKWEEADYVIVNTTYAVMYSEEDYNKIRENYLMIAEYASYGHVVCEVYAKQ